MSLSMLDALSLSVKQQLLWLLVRAKSDGITTIAALESMLAESIDDEQYRLQNDMRLVAEAASGSSVVLPTVCPECGAGRIVLPGGRPSKAAKGKTVINRSTNPKEQYHGPALAIKTIGRDRIIACHACRWSKLINKY